MLNLKNTLDGYLKNVEVIGNTIQDTNNLANIRSVGDKVEGQELYKIDVVSCGKNLVSSFLKDMGTTDRLYFKIHINPNTNYRISSNLNLFGGKISIVDVNNLDIEYLLVSNWGHNKTSFNSGGLSGEYVMLLHGAENKLNYLNNNGYFQLEEGTVITPYEPYQEQKLEILSPVQLEKVGDVADKIVCKDGVWGVEKNITTTYLTRDLSWELRKNSTNVTIFANQSVLNKGVINRVILCNTLNVNSGVNQDNISNYNEILAHKNPTYSDVLYIALNFTTIAEFKTWLDNNPTYIKYANNEPQFIPLPHDQQVKLRTFAGQTNIAFLTEIPGQIKAQVPKSLGATVNTHTEQIADLHNSLERVKKLEETTVSTIETESNFTTVDATSNGYFEDVKLEGKTLVNIANCRNKVQDMFYKQGTGGAKFEHKDLTGAKLCLPTTTAQCLTYQLDKICDVGKIYTIMFTFNNQTNNRLTLFYSLSGYNANNNGKTITQVDANSSSFVKFTFDAIEGCKLAHSLYTATSENECVEIKNLVLLEGDYTNNPPEYFEGLMSVGQDVEEVSVESVDGDGNLFGFESKKFSCNATSDWYDVQGVPNMYSDMTNKTNCKVYLPAGTYTFGYDGINSINVGAFQIVSIDEKIVVNANSNENFQKTYYLSEGVYTIRAKGASVGDVFIKDVYILKGDISKPYTPHQSNKKPLLYFNPTTETWEKPVLREWDSIEKHSDGKYYYHKRSGEGVFDGLEADIRVNADLDVVTRFFVAKRLPNCKGQINGKQIFDRYKFDANFTGAYVHAYIDTDGNAMIFSECKTVEAFKSELQANNVTVVYQLAQEEVYECTNIDLMTYSGETNYIINGGAISPKSLLKVHNNISNVVKILQEKVSLLENTFIAGLKSVLSGDMYSLATILYPEDFEQNDNTEQDIMVIPE